MGLFGRSTEPFLPDRDYLPVAMPTSDMAVLHVLTRQRSVLRRYSELNRILRSGAEEPVVHRDQPVVDAAGSATRHARLGIGLTVVSGILRALGAEGGLDLGAQRATAVEYGYTNVLSDRVDLATLDKWLADADFVAGLRNITDLLVAESVYVVVATLKTSALTVRLVDERGQNAMAGVDVPAVQAAVGGKVTVSGGGTTSAHLTFRGPVALTVAAKAAQLKVDDGGIWVNERLAGGEIRGGLGGPKYTYLAEPQLRLG